MALKSSAQLRAAETEDKWVKSKHLEKWVLLFLRKIRISCLLLLLSIMSDLSHQGRHLKENLTDPDTYSKN